MASGNGALAQAISLLPVLFGLAAVVAVLLYPNRAARPRAAIAMGMVVVVVAVSASLSLGVRFETPFFGRHPQGQAVGGTTSTVKFPAAFSADLSGRLTRQGGGDDDSALTWLIQSKVDNGLTGTLDLSLVGRPAPEDGLSVDSGTVVLRADRGAVCNASTLQVRNNVVTANCSQPAGGDVSLTIQFAIGEGDAVSGHLSGAVGVASAAATAGPSAAAGRPAAPRPHVFVIVLENRSFADALATPYVASLADHYALATNYHSVGEPSLPNYLALASGSTWGIADDSYHRLPVTGIGQQLTSAGDSWGAYMEGFSGDCFNSPYPYALKHNPFAYFGGGCPSNVVPLSRLPGDLRAGTPALSWIVPGLCNDGHDCSAATADSWLAQTVPAILASGAWRQGGALYITWDEAGNASDDHVATLVVAPTLLAQQSARFYNHYSLLATIEDELGVGRLGEAAQAPAMTDLLR